MWNWSDIRTGVTKERKSKEKLWQKEGGLLLTKVRKGESYSGSIWTYFYIWAKTERRRLHSGPTSWVNHMTSKQAKNVTACVHVEKTAVCTREGETMKIQNRNQSDPAPLQTPVPAERLPGSWPWPRPTVTTIASGLFQAQWWLRVTQSACNGSSFRPRGVALHSASLSPSIKIIVNAKHVWTSHFLLLES